MSELLDRLVTMHAYCRPAGSRAELAFIDRYLRPLGPTRDAYGNYHLRLGDSPVMWSCHTDTVHKASGSQRLHLSPSGILTSRHSSCLGADDTAGVFLMCEMIRRNVPGYYVFHYGEEVGCLGSQALADDNPDWLTDITMCIALDRGGLADVITHQLSSRTASDVFADSLAAQLIGVAPYRPSDRGMYTDSESYAHLVAECTNLSVGYAGAHRESESLDTGHVLRLLEALTVLDTSALLVDRTPEDHRWFQVDDYDWRDDYRYRELPDERIWRSEDYLDAVYADVQRELQAQLHDIDPPIRWKAGIRA